MTWESWLISAIPVAVWLIAFFIVANWSHHPEGEWDLDEEDDDDSRK